MRISDWSSDVCSSDLIVEQRKRFGHRRYGTYGMAAASVHHLSEFETYERLIFNDQNGLGLEHERLPGAGRDEALGHPMINPAYDSSTTHEAVSVHVSMMTRHPLIFALAYTIICHFFRCLNTLH